MLAYHVNLLADTERLSAWHRAIHEVVRQGDVVVDVGTGSGILACYACQAGASRVYAIERHDIITVAREVAEANGLKDRIVFLQEDARSVVLPEPADLLLGDVIGVLGFDLSILTIHHHLASGGSLKPDARVIPGKIRVMLAPWEDDTHYPRIDLGGGALHGIGLQPVRSKAMNDYYSTKLAPKGQLAPANALWEVALPPAEKPTRLMADTQFTIERAGLLNGLGGWFVAELSPNVQLATSPADVRTIWGQALLPVDQPVAVKPGDRLQVTLSTPTGGSGGLWDWNGSIERSGARVASFAASSFLGQVLPISVLKAAAADRRPSRSEQGQVLVDMLQAMDGSRSIRELAHDLMSRHPRRFIHHAKALQYVLSVLNRWGDLTTIAD